MDAAQRREALRAAIAAADRPLTGTELAAQLGVSRQVVVQDIALLRARGADILATPAGYLCPVRGQSRPVRVFLCRHNTQEQIRQELMLVVNAGGTVRDVIIEHPVYGEISGALMLHLPYQVDTLLARLERPDSAPLSTVTGGVHLHTVEADSEEALDTIEARLHEAGILISNTGGHDEQA